MTRAISNARAIADASCRLFDLYAGDEATIFSDALDAIAAAIDAVTVAGERISRNETAAFGISGYAYQLLIGAWEEFRVGRGAAAAAMLRPALEAPDYLLACLYDDSFVEDWINVLRSEPIGRARQTVARSIDLLGGRGNEWRTNREEVHRLFQGMPHVSLQVVGRTMIAAPGGRIIAPEGFYSDQLRANSFAIPRMALDLICAMSIAFGGYFDEALKAQTAHLMGDGYGDLNRAFDNAFGRGLPDDT